MVNFLNGRKFKLMLAFISLFLLFDMVQSTYAKYVSSASANGNFTIAKWAFLINQQDVINNADFSNTITPVFEGTEHIKSGVISPTSIGYFEVTIDSTNVEVSFDEEITLSTGLDNTISDLVFDSYTLNNGTPISLSGTSPTVSTTHLLSNENRVNTYKFYVKWYDGTDETMNNALDTAATVDGVASINVNVRLIQRATSTTPEPEPEPEPVPEP